MTTLAQNDKPIEVWLTKANLEITGRIVFEDESATDISVSSLSMRGAQREITAWLIGDGYEAAGRWSTEAADDDGPAEETMRQFRRPRR
jgi:hypothetical protein